MRKGECRSWGGGRRLSLGYSWRKGEWGRPWKLCDWGRSLVWGWSWGKALPGPGRSTGSRARRTPGAIWSCGPSRDVDERSCVPEIWCESCVNTTSPKLHTHLAHLCAGPILALQGLGTVPCPLWGEKGWHRRTRKRLREQTACPGWTARLGWCHRGLLFWPNRQRHCTEKRL